VSLAFPVSVRAVMIDLDGTLLDTVPDIAVAANAMLEELGRAQLDADLIRSFVGKGIPKLVEKTLAESLGRAPRQDEIGMGLAKFERCYAAVNGRHTTMYPGVMEGLNRLREMELPLACVTNKAGRFTQPLLQSTGLRHYFRQVVAGDTLPRKKPDPLPLVHVCRQFNIPPASMLMIGDSLNDAEAARGAGCPVFCVSYGYNEGRDVRDLDIDAIVPSLFEATRLIHKSS
jgi:phosphoglycolate phosphatase